MNVEHQTEVLYHKFREVRIHSTALFPAELSRHVMVNRKKKQKEEEEYSVLWPAFFLVFLFNLFNFIKQMLFLFTFLSQIKKKNV